MRWPLYQVDAFTAEPFAGNPAATGCAGSPPPSRSSCAGTPPWPRPRRLVQVRPDGDRIHLGGRAVTVLRGQLV